MENVSGPESPFLPSQNNTNNIILDQKRVWRCVRGEGELEDGVCGTSGGKGVASHRFLRLVLPFRLVWVALVSGRANGHKHSSSSSILRDTLSRRGDHKLDQQRDKGASFLLVSEGALMMMARLDVERRIACRKLFDNGARSWGKRGGGGVWEFIDVSKGALSSAHQRTWRASSSF
eukprot:TRINITY_DN258_c0_g1_i8.p1 TRINITY_DN258_c0_g1~~TRINITY_DN258_c0_g1_i8.p1  ORF type:complete len:186 (-),score=21.54 TRINITY_DN258_c0_g1_i8:594-1121(-)